MKIAIVVPCFNRCDLTSKTILSLRETTPQNLVKVIAVDDGSTDGTRGMLLEMQTYCLVDRVILHDQQQGVYRSLNDGWHSAVDDPTVTGFMELDNDIHFLRKGWFEAMLARVSRYAGQCIAALQFVPTTDGTLNGGCMLIPRPAFSVLGYFWEGWEDAYAVGDTEYCVRAWKAGVPLLEILAGEWAEHMEEPSGDYVHWKDACRDRFQEVFRQRRNDIMEGVSPVYEPYKRNTPHAP